jgi:hypothetical protein
MNRILEPFRLQLHDHLGEYGPHLHQQLVVRHLREYVDAVR